MQSYLAHSKAYMEDFQPKGANELDLVQELADLRWAMKRMRAILNNSSIYYARKHRAAEKTLKTLQDAQAQRKQLLKEELEEATIIHKAQKTKGEPWDPKEIGFVCSMSQIEAHIRRQW